jgi:DNA-directed DNA polymerase III PolC
MPAFAHLHVHSEYSLLAGVPSVEALADRAAALGFKALALTDANRMSGLILFYNACRERGIRPILGVELAEVRAPGETVVLLARDAEGYGDLCEITTRRQLDGSAFSFERTFARSWPRLHLLTAHPRCLAVLAAGPNRARLHGELVRHSAEARARSREMERICDAMGLPMAASADAWFLDPADHELHRILRAIDLNSTLSRLRPGETAPEGAWLRSAARMAEDFSDRPDALANAAALAEDCRAELSLGRWIMPEIGVPQGHTPDTLLAEAARAGLEANYAGKATYARAREIQEMELGVIGRLGYASYFLMVKEVRDWASRAFGTAYRRARDCSILRGSGANSITFHNMGVCNLDPIAHGLYFQRFLNEDRAAPPDADLDFGWDERERALEHMVERYGRDRVAITCTTNRFRYRAAFRETAKVFGYSDEQVSRVAASLDTRAGRIDDAEIRRIGEWALRLHGKPRFLGQHPGGLIITNQPIWRHVACERTRGGAEEGGGRVVTQIDMHGGIDELGLIKFDLLGNGSLSVLRDALGQLEEQGYPDPEVWDVEKCFRDPAVASMVREGRTRGIFYIESPAQIRLNQRARAETFPEVVITSSLIRPAGTAYCSTFVERRRKMKMDEPRDWEFLHPALEPILEETHDVCAFQEDVIRICHEVAGLPFREADRIRKMMNSMREGEPGSEAREATRRAFIEGCKRDRADGSKGLDEAAAAELWTRISSFTGFSFCKSHSASYAELSFQCAHLKAHYPAQFLSSVISNRHGFYTRGVYLDEARRWGLRILPLCVNRSRLQYHGRDNWIRPGLLPVRDCRETALKVLVEEREANGPYADLPDLLRRVPLHRREAENLVLAGACGAFGLTQPQLLYQLDAVHGTLEPGQADLFGAGPSGGAAPVSGAAAGGSPLDPPALAEYPLLQRCLNELRMLGYVLSANLMHVVRYHPEAKDAVRAEDLGRHVGRRVKVLGMSVTDRLHPVAARPGAGGEGDRFMKFLTLGDNTGYVDAIFWPDVLERWNDTLAGQVPFSGNLVAVWGKVTEDWDTYALEADHVRVVEWLPNQMDFALASRGLREGLRSYPAYAADAQDEGAGETRDVGSLAA